MRPVLVTAFAVVSFIALFTSNAQASTECWYPNEAKASMLRDFHAMLMVGALQCRGTNNLAIEQYNRFVTTHSGLLNANAQVLKVHFQRESGAQQAQFAYDRYVTSLANRQSQKANDPSFCATVDAFSRMAADASEADLLILAQSKSSGPESGICPSSNYATFDTDRRTPKTETAWATNPALPSSSHGVTVHVGSPPAIDPMSSEAQTAATDGAVLETAAATGSPKVIVPPVAGATLASAASPKVVNAPTQPASEQIASAKPVNSTLAAAPAPVSREGALQAAVSALQAATAALQAASASEAKPAKSVPTLAAVSVKDAPIVPPEAVPTP